jgi:carboxymethylenebutenolidase
MREENIVFGGQGRNLDAYLVRPDAPGQRPAIMVISEIWGLDDHIRDVARRFANEGYVALAPNLYTGPPWEDAMKPDNIMAGMMFLRQAPPEIQRDPAKMADALASRSPEEQAALKTLMRVMSPDQRATFARELIGAFSYLRDCADVDPARIASLGFCMGGGLAIYVATLVPELWKTVIFYGENPPLENVARINARVLGLYAGRDRRITDVVPEFQRAMEDAQKSFTYKVYGGTQHAFFNNTRPMHDEVAARDAWDEVLKFLADA